MTTSAGNYNILTRVIIFVALVYAGLIVIGFIGFAVITFFIAIGAGRNPTPTAYPVSPATPNSFAFKAYSPGPVHSVAFNAT